MAEQPTDKTMPGPDNPLAVEQEGGDRTPGEQLTGQIGNDDVTAEMPEVTEGSGTNSVLDADESEGDEGGAREVGETGEVLSPERFWEIIDESEYLVNAEGGDGIEEITNSDYSAPRRSFFHLTEPLGREAEAVFTEAGVSEVVTITPAADLDLTGIDARRFREREGREPLAVVEYMTLNGGRYPYTSYRVNERRLPRHRGEQTSLRWAMVLPQSTADELREAIVEDPELVRLMSEALVTNDEAIVAPPWERDNPITRELWEDCRPPYEEWRDINGGVERIALRDGQLQNPSKARILEF